MHVCYIVNMITHDLLITYVHFKTFGPMLDMCSLKVSINLCMAYQQSTILYPFQHTYTTNYTLSFSQWGNFELICWFIAGTYPYWTILPFTNHVQHTFSNALCSVKIRKLRNVRPEYLMVYVKICCLSWSVYYKTEWDEGNGGCGCSIFHGTI